MIEVFPQVEELANKIIKRFDSENHTQIELNPKYRLHNLDYIRWENFVWTSDKYRRAHIEIVDATKTKRMWVMHMCIFPHYNSPDPIFGFDIVCGKNKITGAFHDFSKVTDCFTYKWYQNKMSQIKWSNPRDLPEWATNIFSPNMVAASNIQTQEELDQLVQTVIDNLDFYLYNIGVPYANTDYKEQHNYYCKNQKLNPHTPAMMVNFGVEKQTFMEFMDEVLFPEST